MSRTPSYTRREASMNSFSSNGWGTLALKASMATSTCSAKRGITVLKWKAVDEAIFHTPLFQPLGKMACSRYFHISVDLRTHLSNLGLIQFSGLCATYLLQGKQIFLPEWWWYAKSKFLKPAQGSMVYIVCVNPGFMLSGVPLLLVLSCETLARYYCPF